MESTEAEIFQSVGLPYVPPDLREDQGEIEAALKGKLPSLVELKDIKGDLHVHTKWSDGKNTIDEMTRAAKSRGYRYIAISTDAHRDIHLEWMMFGLATARRGWIEPRDVINTWPLSKLGKFLGH